MAVAKLSVPPSYNAECIFYVCTHRNQLQIILGGRSSSLVTPYGTGAYESEGLFSELPRMSLLGIS